MDINPDTLESQIPYYLTRDQKEGLIKALSDFNETPFARGYYTSLYMEETLQGDGWSGLEVIRFETGDRNQIKGIILSNTCDISPENIREVPPKIVFAPLIKLKKYEKLLLTKGLKKVQINAKLKAIRKQSVTTMFYLPSGGYLDEEYVAILDDLHSIPSNVFLDNNKRNKLFTLSMFGFYLFLFKLSVHFCRFHENLER